MLSFGIVGKVWVGFKALIFVRKCNAC
jgi:hypothetical protein